MTDGCLCADTRQPARQRNSRCIRLAAAEVVSRNRPHEIFTLSLMNDSAAAKLDLLEERLSVRQMMQPALD